MKVVVLGGGVIGICTAYYLARAGAEVTVVDRQPGPALETSFANAGQVSPGYSMPWAAPGVPLKALKWMFQRHAPLAMRPDGTLWQLRWMAQLLANCTESRYAITTERLRRISQYSRTCLGQLRAETGIAYEQRLGGTLQVFRTQAQVDAAARDIAVLRECGVAHQLLDRSQLASVEPGLAAARERLAGGLRLPDDETGDCHLFTQQLAAIARGLGVTFRFGQIAEGFEMTGERIAGVRVRTNAHARDGIGAASELLTADHFVLALGSYSRRFLASTRIALPVYPVKGYSLTVPLVDEALAPRSTVLDETYKIAITRFDRRIRVGGMAELAGIDHSLNPRRRATLEMVTRDLFPGGDLPNAEFWTGLRPMTPDSTPVIGPTHHDNLHINTGHGTLGWTMACGSGKLVADLVTGRPPDIRCDDLGIDRYGSGSQRMRAAIKPGSP